MTPPRVTGIITSLDNGRTIADAVQSLRDQTLPLAETVIVDAGSTDVFTQQELLRLTRAGHSVLRTHRRGVAAARNLGVRSTRGDYIVLLDADSFLDDRYLDLAASRLSDDPTLAFVSSAARRLGSERIWTPPQPDLTVSLIEGFPHVSSVFRRTLWEALGGFDETLQNLATLDFWMTALERGFRGEVLPDALVHYRATEASMRCASYVRNGADIDAVRRLHQKHSRAFAMNAEGVLSGKDHFVRRERERQTELRERLHHLENELQMLHQEIAAVVRELRSLGSDRVDFGDLRRISPISPVWGLDRGMPLDRYYIHGFLDRHRSDIRGRVLEIKDPGYTRLFGGEQVSSSEVLDIDPSNPHATIVIDLAQASAVPDDTYDAFILTQTLGVIYDVASALRHACRILKPGGVLLCTVPATGRISYEEGLDGDFWRFTEASVRQLFNAVFPVDAFEVEGFGNVLASAAFLYGLSPDEISPSELDAVDPYFPVILAIRAVKPGGQSERSVSRAAVQLGTRPAQLPAAVLMYHRVGVQERDPYSLCMSPEDFRFHMRHLERERFRVVPLSQLICAAHDTHRSPAVAITFDDGYSDALTSVTEILAEFSFPATFFIVGAALEPGYEYWWDALERAFAGSQSGLTHLTVSTPEGKLRLPTFTAKERLDAHARLDKLAYGMAPAARQSMLSHVFAWSGGTLGSNRTQRPMDADEVIRLAALPGVSVGAHSENHLALPLHVDEIKRVEIIDCKHRLEHLLRGPVTAFSYPYGACDDATVAIVRDAGFETAVIVSDRPLREDDDALRLPRLDIKGNRRQFAERLNELVPPRS